MKLDSFFTTSWCPFCKLELSYKTLYSYRRHAEHEEFYCECNSMFARRNYLKISAFYYSDIYVEISFDEKRTYGYTKEFGKYKIVLNVPSPDTLEDLLKKIDKYKLLL